MMDTKTLVVGEDVYIHQEYLGHCWGKVTKIAPSGVEIQHTTSGKVYRLTPSQGGTPLVESASLPTMFDTNGKACDGGIEWELAFEDTDDRYPIGTKLEPLEKIPPNKSWGTTLEY